MTLQGQGPSTSRIRWFVAELLVVIVGILIALALQSVWQRRGDVARERAYLEGLLADTRQNELIVVGRIRADSAARERSLRLVRIMRDGHALPPRDTLAALSRMATSSLALASATHDALVGTGDVRLLRDPVIRSSTLCIANLIGQVQSSVNSNVEVQRGLVNQRTATMLRHVGASGSNTVATEDLLDIGWWSRVDFEKLRRDPDALAPFQINVYILFNSLSALRRLRPPLVQYREQLERHLAGKPAGEPLCYK